MEAWDKAEAALLANGSVRGDTTMEMMRMMREGHPNMRAGLEFLLRDLTECQCGDDDCGFATATPTRIDAANALRELIHAVNP